MSLVVKCKWTKSRIPCAIKWEDGTSDHIVQYAGVQVAFFFHLFNTFTRPGIFWDRNTVYGSKVASIHSCMRDNSYRWLAGPAVLSTVNFVLRRGPWLDKHQVRSLGCLKLLMFNFRLKLLVGPVGTCIRHSPSLQMQMLDSAYGAMLCIWTTVFLVAWRDGGATWLKGVHTGTTERGGMMF